MKKTMLISIMMLVCTAPWAMALTTFTFDGGIEDTGSDSAIGTYMSGIYGSEVVVDDAEVRDNRDDNPDWGGKNSRDNFLRVDVSSGDMEILFLGQTISRAYGDGYVFDRQIGSDFHVYGYDDSYGSHENPNRSALVGSQSINTWFGRTANFDVTFASPVTLLVFSDNGVEDIGIDNLSVEESVNMPVPGAFALTGIGASLVGWMRRRKMIS